MNEQWDKEGSLRSDTDRKKLADIHLAVIGDKSLGVPGLVGDMREVKTRLRPLEEARDGGVTLGGAMRIVGAFTLGLFLVAGAIVAIIEAIKKS